MSRARWILPALAFLAATGWVAAPVEAVDSTDPLPLAGVVRDAAGNLLEGVQILVLSESRGLAPLARANTDAGGRFSIFGLAPGVYRVAAVKPGYQTFMGRIDTLLSMSLDVLLRRGEGGVTDAHLPDSADWVLRVPARSILRELDRPEAVIADSAPARSSLLDELHLTLDQRFVLGELGLDRAAATSLQGRETAMSLSSSLGDRGAIRLAGNQQRLSGTPYAALDPARSEQASVLVDLSYATGLDAKVDMRAYYDQFDLAQAVVAGAAVDRAEHGQRSWGYDAAWSVQMDPVSRVSVQVDYRDLSVEIPAKIADAPPAGEASAAALVNRRIGAGGSYESTAAEGHRVRVDLRAQFVESPARFAALAIAPTAQFGGSPDTGWTFRVTAEDSWAVSGPLTVVSGLGYRHSLAGNGTAVVVPRFGAVWSPDWISMKVILSYAATSHDQLLAPDLVPADEWRPRSGVGYLAHVRVPLTRALSLSGESEFSPVLLDSIEYPLEDPGFAQAPLFLSDGDAAIRRTSLALTHDSLLTRTSLRFSEGTAEGILAPQPYLTLPIQPLSGGSLGFRDSSLGVRVNPWGTELVVAYREVQRAAERSLLGPPAFGEESIELRVAQDVLQMLQGSWRVLFAMRVADVEMTGADALVLESSDHPFAPAGQHLSAGLSVTF